jgi:hypothetical protein
MQGPTIIDLRGAIALICWRPASGGLLPATSCLSIFDLSEAICAGRQAGTWDSALFWM